MIGHQTAELYKTSLDCTSICARALTHLQNVCICSLWEEIIYYKIAFYIEKVKAQSTPAQIFTWVHESKKILKTFLMFLIAFLPEQILVPVSF